MKVKDPTPAAFTKDHYQLKQPMKSIPAPCSPRCAGCPEPQSRKSSCRSLVVPDWQRLVRVRCGKIDSSTSISELFPFIQTRYQELRACASTRLHGQGQKKRWIGRYMCMRVHVYIICLSVSLPIYPPLSLSHSLSVCINMCIHAYTYWFHSSSSVQSEGGRNIRVDVGDTNL